MTTGPLLQNSKALSRRAVLVAPPGGVLQMLEVSFAHVGQADGSAHQAVDAHRFETSWIKFVVYSALGVSGMILDDLIAQDPNLYARKLQTKIDVGVLPSGTHVFAVEAVDVLEVGPANREVAAEYPPTGRLIEKGQDDSVLDEAGLAAKAEPQQVANAETEPLFQNCFRRRELVGLDVHTAAGHDHTWSNVTQMLSHKIVVGHAVHIHEDELVGAADENGAIEDARLAKTLIILAHMLDGVPELRRPPFEQGPIILLRPVVGDDQFEIRKRLLGKSGERAGQNFRFVIGGDHNRRGRRRVWSRVG